MTFKPETNPKEENNQKSKDTLNETTDGVDGKISTIYDPRKQCGPTSLPPSFNAVPVHKNIPDLTKQKRTVVETIKKITLKLKPKTEDMQKRRLRCAKCALVLAALLCKLGLITIFFLTYRSGKYACLTENIAFNGITLLFVHVEEK